MQLADLGASLKTVIADTYHYKAFKKSDKYLVWAEDTQADASYADNHMTNQVIQGTIDYFTKIEFDPNFESIQEKLNSIDIAWKLSSIQHEEETGYIHYEWVWEMII